MTFTMPPRAGAIDAARWPVNDAGNTRCLPMATSASEATPRRCCAHLIRPGGTPLVETTPDTAVHGLWPGSAQAHHTDTTLPARPWFPWPRRPTHRDSLSP